MRSDPCPARQPNPSPRTPAPSFDPLLSAAAAGPADLLRAMTDLQLATERQTRAQGLLSNLAGWGVGQGHASRMYELSLAGGAYQSRLAAAEASARQRTLESPLGQRQYLAAGRAADLASVAQSGLGQRQAELDARRMQSPEYQRAANAQAALDAAEGLNRLRAAAIGAAAAADATAAMQRSPAYRAAVAGKASADAAESINSLRVRVMAQQATAAHAATPAGMAQTRERSDLTEAGKQAELKQQQAENVAAYGRVGGAAMNAYQGLGRMTAAMNPYIAAVKGAADTMVGFAAAASPSAMSTFNSSIELMSAKIGHTFVPALNAASDQIQNLGSAAQQFLNQRIGNGTPGGFLSGYAVGSVKDNPLSALAQSYTGQRSWTGAAMDAMTFSLEPFIKGFSGKSLGEHFESAMGWKTGENSGSRNIVMPTTSRMVSDISQFGDMATQSSMNLAGKETQVEVLREILKEITKSNDLYTGNTEVLRSIRHDNL